MWDVLDFFCTKSLKFSLYFTLKSTSQFQLGMFQVTIWDMIRTHTMNNSTLLLSIDSQGIYHQSAFMRPSIYLLILPLNTRMNNLLKNNLKTLPWLLSGTHLFWKSCKIGKFLCISFVKKTNPICLRFVKMGHTWIASTWQLFLYIMKSPYPSCFWTK